MSLGEKLKYLRNLKKVNQATVAKLLNISQQAYAKYEKDITEPDTDSLKILSSYFNVSIDYLLGAEIMIRTGNNKNEKIKIPVVGEIKAGLPAFADENIIDYEEIPDEMAKDGEYFGLKVKGDSMLPRIVEGDVVIVKKQNTADNGDICVVLVNGDSATLKKVKFADNGIMLIPNNQNYETMFYSKTQIQELPVEIIGKVVELRGKF